MQDLSIEVVQVSRITYFTRHLALHSMNTVEAKVSVPEFTRLNSWTETPASVFCNPHRLNLELDLQSFYLGSCVQL
jgi:hypothetical protein